MLDFAALPPEINSARMYSGPGSGTMLAAASAWDALAAQLESYAAGYSSVLSDLQGENWSGSASFAMAGALAPYVAWATTTAAQAEQAASQARAAVAAYESAFAATAPPAVVTANRIQVAMLVATNFLGQNTPAIAATEAAYAEMWAQDAAAMYGYAASSSAATALTPFSEPPKTTNSAGRAVQTAVASQNTGSAAGHIPASLSEVMSALPQQLQTLASAASTYASTAGSDPAGALPSILTAFSEFNTLTGPLNPLWQTAYAMFSAGQFGTGLNLATGQAAKAAATGTASEAGAPGLGSAHPSVLARVGEATPVGKLSVPSRWAAADPVTGGSNGALSLPQSDPRLEPVTHSGAPTNSLAGPSSAGRESRPNGSLVLRNGRRAFKMPRPAFGG